MKRQNRCKHIFLSVLLLALVTLMLPTSAAAADVTNDVSFTSIKVLVNKGSGSNLYAEFECNSGNWTQTYTAPSHLKINKGDTLVFEIYWEVLAAKMVGITGGSTMRLPIQSSNYLTFEDTAAQPLKDGNGALPSDATPPGPGVIGSWKVLNSAIEVEFDNNVTNRSHLENGHFVASGKATSTGTGVTLNIGGLRSFPIDIEPPPAGGLVGPVGTPEKVSKEGGQLNTSENTITWTVGVNNDSVETLFNGGTPEAMNNVVMVDELSNGQTITTNDITMTMQVRIPYFNELNSADPNNGKLLNTSITYMNIKSHFTPVPDDGSYSGPEAFTQAVKDQAPAFGVYGKNYVVVAPGALNGGTQPSSSLKVKDLIDAHTSGAGIDSLITSYTASVLNNTQKTKIKDAYYNTGNAVNGGLLGFNVIMKANAEDVSTGSVGNSVQVGHDGGILGEKQTAVNFTNIYGGVQGGSVGRVTLTKTDQDSGALLEQVGFVLHRWNNSTSQFEPYLTTPVYTDDTGTLTFGGLPNGQYKLVESNPLPGYSDKAIYNPSDTFTINHAANDISIFLSATNQLLPDEPQKPHVPKTPKPNVPTTPNPNTPDTPTPKPNVEQAGNAPKVGDNSPMEVWTLGLLVAVTGTLVVAGLVFKNRLRRKGMHKGPRS